MNLQLDIPADGRILYFERDRESFGFMSHFHPSRFYLFDQWWPTAEHCCQAQKTDDPEYRRAIREAITPGKVKKLGQSWFRRTGRPPRSDWYEAKLEIMRAVDLAKFSQNPGLSPMLIATGTADLIEDSPFDSYWGIGRDGMGFNWAGQVLMEIRERLGGRVVESDAGRRLA